VAALGLVVFVLLVLVARQPTSPTTFDSARPSIAVLPFGNLSGEPAQDLIADGFAAEIITELARNGELTVLARNSSFAMGAEGRSSREVAQALRVRYLLEGSVRRLGDSLRLTTSLVDGGTGTQLWAERFDIVAPELAATQDEIVQRVAGILFSEVRSTEKAAALRSSPDSFDVYLLALHGLALKHQFTAEAYR
jgi:adenylate cyclase